jgi:hypothetical protein
MRAFAVTMLIYRCSLILMHSNTVRFRIFVIILLHVSIFFFDFFSIKMFGKGYWVGVSKIETEGGFHFCISCSYSNLRKYIQRKETAGMALNTANTLIFNAAKQKEHLISGNVCNFFGSFGYNGGMLRRKCASCRVLIL